MKPGEILSCCGTCCSACAAHGRDIAVQAEQFQNMLRRQGFLEMARELHPEETEKIASFHEVLDRIAKSPACPGCQEGGGEKSCPIRSCCRSKGHTTCSDCSDLQSCGNATERRSPTSSLQMAMAHDRRKARGETAFPMDAPSFFKRITWKYGGWNMGNLLLAQKVGHPAVVQMILSREGFRTWHAKVEEDPESGRP